MKKLFILLFTLSIFLSQSILVFAAEPSPWAKEWVLKAADDNISVFTNDYTAGITRHDMSYLVASLLREKLSSDFLDSFDSSKNHPFSDVTTNHYPINLCYSTGIISGTSPTTFSPNDALTREQAATIIVRAINYIESKTDTTIFSSIGYTTQYADNSSISSWAVASVSTVTSNNIMSGNIDGNFYPLKDMSYEEAIILTHNAFIISNRIGLSGTYSDSERQKMKYIITKYNRINSRSKEMEEHNIYIDEPMTTSPFSKGMVETEYIQLGIDNINLARYIAGLDNNVILNENYVDEVQAAAVVMYANGDLSHSPSKPSGMEEDLYLLGKSGASKSNLSLGSSIPSSVWSYMNDSDSSNISRVGHRRWILNPAMGSSAFGQAGRYSAMYAFDSSNKNPSSDFSTWPSDLFPIQLLPNELAWSVSVPSSYISSKDDVSVTLTRERDNKKWTIDKNIDTSNGGYFNVDTGGYGGGPAIIFRPPYLSETNLYFKEDVFNVSVSGLTVPIAYTVKLFDTNDMELIKNTEPNPPNH